METRDVSAGTLPRLWTWKHRVPGAPSDEPAPWPTVSHCVWRAGQFVHSKDYSFNTRPAPLSLAKWGQCSGQTVTCVLLLRGNAHLLRLLGTALGQIVHPAELLACLNHDSWTQWIRFGRPERKSVTLAGRPSGWTGEILGSWFPGG